MSPAERLARFAAAVQLLADLEALVSRWPHYRLVLEDGSVATVRRRAVLAIAHAPAETAEPNRG